MSLFQAREWWSTQAGQDEEFHEGCLCVANIDNEGGGANKIITGSLQGTLRMYIVKQKDYKIEDLILEKDMEAPILQVVVGRFVQNSRDICLALLHPNKLAIYMVSAVSSGGSVNYYSLMLCYEHQLTRPAFNMCCGPFGQIRERDYICVQSLDGVMSFFEQDSFAFSRVVSPNFLVPGPICYMPKFDLFLICSNSMAIEAYRYQVLAAAADNVDVEANREGPGKKVQVDWSTNIGEHAIHIQVARFSRSLPPNQQEILVVGERTVFTVKENGGIRLQKRFSEYQISAALCYKLPAEASDAPPFHNLLLCTHRGHLMVLREMQLVWCARISGMIPMQVCCETISNTRGMIIFMDNRGKVQVTYLGTDPPTASLVNTEMKELNYDEMEEEHQDLLRIIRQTHGEGAREAEEKLVIQPQVPSVLDQGCEENYTDADDPVGRVDGVVMQCTVFLNISLQGGRNVENVTVTLKAPSCFSLSQTSFTIEKVNANERPHEIPIVFRVWNTVLCSGLDILACASYFSANNEPRTVVCDFRLPMALVAKLIQPVKTATYKIQLDCNRQPPALTTLFAGLLSQPHVSASFGQQVSTLLTVQYVSGTEATVVMSKNACRFCVQASEFASLWVLTQELCQRLTEHFEGQDSQKRGKGAQEEPFMITYQDSLPLHDYFALMDDHFALRKHLEELRTDLADRTQQYRVLQKRLLVRFKDKNPSPLNHLDALLTLTFEQTLQLTEAIDDVERALRTVSCHLSAATELVLLLIRFRFELDEENFRVLRLHLSPEMCDTVEQGWEEQVDASLIHLLRTSLARNAKDRSALPPPMKVPQDTLKLKKRITSVVDRLANGGRIAGHEAAGGGAEEGGEEGELEGNDD